LVLIVDDFYLNREIIRLKAENQSIREQLTGKQSKHLPKITIPSK